MLWKLLWLLIATAIAGYYGWSIHLTMMQKKAWKAFATRYKLTFHDGGFMTPPAMQGRISGYPFRAYTEILSNTFLGRSGNWTIMELTFDPAMKDASLIMVSAELADEIEQSPLYKPFKPASAGWGDTELRSEKPDVFKHLDDGKIDSLKRLIALKGGYIFITDADGAIVSARTRSPLDNPNEMNAILKVLVSVAENWQTPNTPSAQPKPVPKPELKAPSEAAPTLSFEDETAPAPAQSAEAQDGHKETVI